MLKNSERNIVSIRCKWCNPHVTKGSTRITFKRDEAQMVDSHMVPLYLNDMVDC